MAALSTNPTAEFDAYAANLVASGEFADKSQVLLAAMDALRRERTNEGAYDEACARAMEEAEGSEIIEGDLIADVRSHFNLPPASR